MTFHTDDFYYPSDAEWENLMCRNKCMGLAHLLIDGEPYCLQCAEEYTDYVLAIELDPSWQSMMPPPHLRS